MTKHEINKKGISHFSFSPIALGTHLGNMDVADSALYQASIEYGLLNGVNFIDTAINYRGMRSERDIGIVISKLIGEGLLKRGEIVVATKAGIIPGDIDAKLVPSDYLKTILLDEGIITPSDLNIVDHQRHVLAPSYYEFAIEQNKKHLNLHTIDIHYIHNPELSLEVLGEDVFYRRLEPLFAFYEDQVVKGNIRFYGFATWHGLLRQPNEKGFISLERVMGIVKKVVGEKHHFQFIQCPFNQVLTEAKTLKNQLVRNEYLSVFEAAKALGLTLVTSAPFHLGKLVDKEDPNKLLRFALEEQDIYSIMVGMKTIDHVKDNLNLIKV